MPYDRSAFTTRTALEATLFDYMVDAKDYIADAIFTPKPVKKGLFKQYQTDTSKFRYVDTKKGTNAEPQLVDEQVFTSNVSLIEHKLGREVNPRDVEDADMPGLLDVTRAAKQVMNHLLIDRELEAATKVRTAANYVTGLTTTLGAGSRWNEAAGNPEGDRLIASAALRLQMGGDANAAAMGVDTYEKITQSPAFIERTKFTNGGPVGEDVVKRFLKVDHLFIGKARYDSANEPNTPVIGGFWGGDVLFFRYDPSSDMQDSSFGHMYYRNTPIWTQTIVDEKRHGAAGSMTRVVVGSEYALAPGFIESSSSTKYAAGYLFKTVVA